MALKPVEFTEIVQVLRGPKGKDGKDGEPGPKGDKGDKGDPGKDGRDGRDGKDAVVDQSRLEALQNKLTTDLESLKKKLDKVEKRRPENYFPGGGGTQYEEIVVTFDGGGLTLVTGDTKTYYVCSYPGIIRSWYLTGDPSGSLVVDVWKAANAIPTVANTITGTDKPTLVSQAINLNQNASAWSRTVAAGDIFGFAVNSVSAVTKAILTIKIEKQ